MTQERAQPPSKSHFEVLDGLRGVAALIVVLFHSYKGGGIVINGALAVDLFFLLSGFVIAYSYDDRVLSGVLPVGGFILRRIIRLYPILVLGAFGGVAIALIHNVTNPAEAYPLTPTFIAGGLSLAGLPYLVPDALSHKNFTSAPIFPFNPPMWSLFFELLANLVYVFILRWLNVRVLLVAVVAGLAGVAWFGPLGGGEQASIWAGLPRVVAGFFGGVLLFKLRSQSFPFLQVRSNFLILSAVLISVACVPVAIGGLAYIPTYFVLCGIVICASNAAKSRLDGMCSTLGLASYPIYLVHWTTLYVFTGLEKKLANRLGIPSEHSEHLYVLVVALHLVFIVYLGVALARYYETPIRVFLTQHLLQRPSVVVRSDYL
jgi:peptidoglycan/LPS O-acetylase OafA/YrhL